MNKYEYQYYNNANTDRRENVLAQSPSSTNKMFEWLLSRVKPVNCLLLDIPARLSNAVGS